MKQFKVNNTKDSKIVKIILIYNFMMMINKI